MRALTTEAVRSLAASHEAPCLSVYLPTHGGKAFEDRPKLEGLVRRAKEALKDQLSAKQIDAVLQPLIELAAGKNWSDELAGAAIFLARGFHAHYRLPVEVRELLVVADSFHIRPL